MTAGELVGGALLGAPVSELLKLVIDVITKTIEFKPILNRLQATLNSLQSTFYQIGELHIELEIPVEVTGAFLDLLISGKELVMSCSETGVLTKAYHTTKLLELEDSLLKFFQINVQAQMWRDHKILLKDNKMLLKEFRALETKFIIQNFDLQIPGYNYKLLVTSRSQFPRFDGYALEALNDENGQPLFCYSAIPSGNDLGNKVVKGCRASPHAFEVVGGLPYKQPVMRWKFSPKKGSEEKSVLHSVHGDPVDVILTSLDELAEVRDHNPVLHSVRGDPLDVIPTSLDDELVEVRDHNPVLHSVRGDPLDVIPTSLDDELVELLDRNPVHKMSKLRFGQLMNLRKLSVVNLVVGDAFSDPAMFSTVVLPHLKEVHMDRVHNLKKLPTGLCNLHSLEMLSITNCNELSALPEGIGRLINLKAMILNSCMRLKELPESIGDLQNLRLLNLTGCRSLTKLPSRTGELCCLKSFHMSDCWSLDELPPSVKDLQNLEEVICDEQTSDLWEAYKNHLEGLSIKVLEEDT